LQHLKLFVHLNIDDPPHHNSASFCLSDFTEEELFLLDDSVVTTEPLSPHLAASLYYSCEYVIAFKENFLIETDVILENIPESEFVREVSRGGLIYPMPELYGFGRSCLHVFSEITKHTSHQTIHTHCTPIYVPRRIISLCIQQ
jgi:hypothetical protein